MPESVDDSWMDAEIDIDIRRLVSLMNRWGLRTVSSCAGHDVDPYLPGVQAYICFTADDQATVRAFIDLLPNWGTHATFSGFQLLLRHVGIHFSQIIRPDLDPKALVYRLTIAGTPLYYQRAQIEAIERALSVALAARA